MSVHFLPLGQPLRVSIHGQRPCLDASVRSCWTSACAANPKLFDGPILTVRSIDAASGRLTASPDRFAHVVCQPDSCILPVTILSVTGVVIATSDTVPHVLLARRGRQTRSYPGMWEFAPAGGLGEPKSPTFGIEGVLPTLAAELNEEVGIADPLRDERIIGLVVDPHARSVDIVIRAEVANGLPSLRTDGAHAWECIDARWVPVHEFERETARLDGGVIEPTLAIARHLGWTR